jgi:peroxiredoxin
LETCQVYHGIISSVNLNAPAPDFLLPDLNGHPHRLSDYRGRIVVVNFWSAECPWSERADKYLMATMRQLPDQVAVLPIASNANETDEMINGVMHQRGLTFVLRDAGGEVAEAWGAETTPHAFVVDASGILRYRGAVDDVTFRQRTPSRFFLDEAVEALLAGHPPAVTQAPAYGCTIVREI